MVKILKNAIEYTLGSTLSESMMFWVYIALVALLSFAMYWLLKGVMIPIVRYISRKTSNEWDNDLLNVNVLSAVVQLAPALWVASMLPDSFSFGSTLYVWSVKLTRLYILWASIHLILVFLRALQDAIDRRHILKQHNLEIIRQTLALFVFIIGIIVGIGILVNRDPVAVLTAFGASAAVLMLVFRDTILGFVAGIQLTVNRMIGRGDWIIAPKAGANGEVEEIKLTTVKVRNWDNSIVTIPPYTLFTDSFQNFKSMRTSGARRVCRYVSIDIDSVRHLTAEEIAELKDKRLLVDSNSMPTDINLTLFRNYLEEYLSHYPTVITSSSDYLLMVRQLQSTPTGIPLELYFFTTITDWKGYEKLQADVFDHLFATVPLFGLKVYQAPSGQDIRNHPVVLGI